MALSFQSLATTNLLPVSLHLPVLCGTYKWNSTTQLSNSTPRNIPKTTENSAQTGMCTQMLVFPGHSLPVSSWFCRETSLHLSKSVSENRSHRETKAVSIYPHWGSASQARQAIMMGDCYPPGFWTINQTVPEKRGLVDRVR